MSDSSTKLTGLMVGMFHRPPAKDVLNSLPVGTKLWLQREPDNAYDENAVKVLLPGFGPGGEHADLRAGLEATGKWGEEMFTDPLHLAYVDSSKTGMAKIFSEAILETGDDNALFAAELSYSIDGKPQVVTELQVVAEQDLETEADDEDLEEFDED